MKIDGLTMDSMWAGRALRERGVDTEQYTKVDSEIVVQVNEVSLGHHGREMNYRPFLHLTGELKSVRPEVALPDGIHEVTFPSGTGSTVDAYYEFTDQQLGQLASKGYFNKEFKVPDGPNGVTGIDWELPATVDMVAMPAADAESVPVIFVNVHDLGSLNVDQASCGYDLAEYFEEQSMDLHRIEQDVSLTDLNELSLRNDNINPMFVTDDMDFGVEDSSYDPNPLFEAEEPELEPSELLEAELKIVEATLSEEAEAIRAERELKAGSLENVYRERIAWALSTKDAETVAQPVDETAEPEAETSQFLDFSQFDEDDGEPAVTVDQMRNEDLKKKIARRAAQIIEPVDNDRQGPGL